MNLGEILIWESSNLLLLVPVVIGLVMLVRWLQGRAVFTEWDWLLLFRLPPRRAVLTLRLSPIQRRSVPIANAGTED